MFNEDVVLCLIDPDLDNQPSLTQEILNYFPKAKQTFMKNYSNAGDINFISENNQVICKTYVLNGITDYHLFREACQGIKEVLKDTRLSLAIPYTKKYGNFSAISEIVKEELDGHINYKIYREVG